MGLRAIHIGLALIFVGLLYPLQGQSKPERLRVVIDPGHGGQNMGAVGPYGVYEKYVTLEIALRLGRLLQQEEDVAVFYTRKDDIFVGLSDRAELANAIEADLFISIHCNASPSPDARGIETYYYGKRPSDALAQEVVRRENSEASQAPKDELEAILGELQRNGVLTESFQAAQFIQEALRRAFPETPSRDVRQGDFTVLERAKVPAVVVEVGFITNPEEGLDLIQGVYQERIAQALRDAILSYLRAGAQSALRLKVR